MGTVGISFGSPTSGAGFDVSQTVSQIVSNLQQVETPWKTQLSTLQGQDTALSNLGTLLSNLSNDVSQFTDFQGILANKTGSSSDNNVLQLTGASPSAIAGTHTIVVTSLAQTSSGYMTSITNASDSLSGSITIKVGTSGTAQTIAVPTTSGNNTLAGLSAAINAAGIGVTANVITDANGSRLSLVSGTSGTGGNLTVTPNSLTDTTTSASLAYTTSQTGANAVLTVDGVSISNASNTVTNVIPGVTFQLLSYNPSEQIQVVIANDTSSVESVVGAFVSDYNAVISGINTQEGTDSSGNAEPLYGSPTLSLLQQQILGALATENPSGYIDPVSSTDTLSGSISIQVGSGSPQTINVPSGDNTLSGLENAINTANIGVTAAITTDSTGSYLKLISGTVGSAGTLTVNSSLTDTTTSTSLNYNNSGGDIGGLTGLGVSVNNDGTLTLDQTSLSTALTNDYSGVVSFFQDANGWGQNFSAVLTNSGSSSTGLVGMAVNSDSNIESNLNADISRQESTISIQQRSLTLEMNSVNEILQALPSELNQANELYSAITGYNQTQNG